MNPRTSLAARVLAAAVLALTISACGASAHKSFHQQVLAYLGSETVGAPRPCGYLAAGIGWRVRASTGVTCGAAHRLLRTFFTPQCRRAQRQPGKTCGVLGYSCIELYLPSNGSSEGAVWCATAIRSVTAISNT